MGGPGRDVVVIVLAAGHGRRLGPRGGAGPKWLIDVGGEPIAERHLEAFEQVLGRDGDVLVVVGHNAERVAAWTASRAAAGGLRPTLVRNPRHATANNWASLLVGLDEVAWRHSPEAVVVVVNSDLCADPAWIGAFVDAARRLDGVPAALAVDVERPLTDEAMKVAAGEPDADGRRWCTAIGKVGVADPVGEYVGMTALLPEGRRMVHEELRRFDGDPARTDAWYEGAYQVIAERQAALAIWPTPSSDWVEIDDPADLDAAEALLGAAGRSVAAAPPR